MKKLVIFLLTSLLFFACKQSLNTDADEVLPDPLEAGWKGEKVCEVMQENDELRVLKCSFPPGIGHEIHSHQPHYGYTLAGGKFKITNEEGTKEVEVPTGSSWSNDEVTTHEVQNIGETTAVFLIMEWK